MVGVVKELKKFIEAPEDYLDDKGKLAIEISGCSLLAAPVLLFFLKRRGFSSCKAWAGPTGLAISAER